MSLLDSTPTILITGGAGYVGSHSVLHFQSLGWEVVTLDNLVTGHSEFAALADSFVHGDLQDRRTLQATFQKWRFDGVLHCAARSLVGESVRNPRLYYQQNVGGMLNLLDEVVPRRIPLVFSSSAAVYGEPSLTPIPESHPRTPINPYGFTKFAIEKLLEDCYEAHELRSMRLRYFNVAGADPESRVGERHHPESHLVPLILKSVIDDEGRRFKLFGDDYDTPDGTCIRDYVHPCDLARAHALALQCLFNGNPGDSYNIGSGNGFSVRQVFDAAQSALGREIPLDVVDRRPGDPSVLLADSSRARRELGWEPAYKDIHAILATAVDWHRLEAAGHRR